MTGTVAPSRHVIVFATSEYEDTPWAEWAPEDVELHILVSDHLAGGYAHLPNVQAFSNYRAPGVDLAALEIARQVRPCAVVTRGEVDVLRAARLRELADVPGQRWESAVAFRDKVVMKRLLAAAGIPVPAFTEVQTPLDLVDFVEQHGLPAVVKPVRGSGSLGTVVVRAQDELRRLLEDGVGDGLEVEEFVPGTMYLVDGLVRDSQIAFMRTSRYANGCLAFRDGNFMGVRLLDQDDEVSERLRTIARRVLDCLPTPPHTAFHLEVFRTPDDRLVVCEIASRTGGVRIKQMIAYAEGVDLDREWFNAQIGAAPSAAPAEEPRASRDAVGHIVIYPQPGVLVSLPAEPPPSWVVGEKVAGGVGRHYDAAQKCGDFVVSYLITAPTGDEVEARFEHIARWFDERVSWSAAPQEATAW
jgi:biotin carboxylase